LGKGQENLEVALLAYPRCVDACLYYGPLDPNGLERPGL
jgi:hypothetical protein